MSVDVNRAVGGGGGRGMRGWGDVVRMVEVEEVG